MSEKLAVINASLGKYTDKEGNDAFFLEVRPDGNHEIILREKEKFQMKNWELDEQTGLIKSDGQIIAKVFDSENAKLIASLPEICETLSRVNKLLGVAKS